MRFGTHAQGNLGFRKFLFEIGLPTMYARTAYRVRTELPGDESRIDVEVACPREFLLHIECKIWSGEGEDQTSREWTDMQRRSRELGIPKGKREHCVHGLLLTLDGTGPKDNRFQPITWRQVARVFDSFGRDAEPQDVKVFSYHMATTLRGILPETTITEEYEDGEQPA